jgi:integrase
MAKLTDAAVRAACGPGLLWDSDDDPKKAETCISGFGLRVHAGGAKSFFMNYRLHGRQGRKTIGTWPTWSVEAARAEAKELRKRVDRGEDPAKETRARRDAPTVQDLIDRYVAEHLPKKGAKAKGIEYLEKTRRYRADDERRMLAVIGGHLGKHTKVADIHGGDIKAMHQAITDRGTPIRANRILSIASKMFTLSLVPVAGEDKPWRDQAQGNPCKYIEKNHEEEAGRLYSQDELAAISDALAAYPGVAADCVRLVMLTGCRPQEATLATWEQFDKEPGKWIKPSAHVKAQKRHELSLGAPALELIERLRKDRNGPWVFPGDKPGLPLARLHHCWAHVREHAKLGADCRLYDLRHSFAATAASGGLSLLIIGRLLGHTQARTTQRYARHLADDPVRAAADKVAAVIAGAGKPGAEVKWLKG